MKLHNSLTKKIIDIDQTDSPIGIYSCGPTVYDNVHIGNLFSFIVADQVRRALQINDQAVTHVMNTTDVDDKTIKRAVEEYPDDEPLDGLLKLTAKYEQVFVDDAEKVGINMRDIELVRATEHITEMQDVILELIKKGVGYISEDGIYFSIDAYKKKHAYGVLVTVTSESTGKARVNNDEYDKDNIHDFALWKFHSGNEPSWDFEIDGKNYAGRPGWHIECSAMSIKYLGQPFEIHTGGVDLKFPHHENEIAQCTGATGEIFANVFVHNEHVLVDGKKMAKSAGNFFTLRDIEEKGYDPLAFRLLTLQNNYRHQLNFSWKSLDAAAAFLQKLRAFSDLKHQAKTEAKTLGDVFITTSKDIAHSLANDLDTAGALAQLALLVNKLEDNALSVKDTVTFNDFLEFVDSAFGLELSSRDDISYEQKQMITDRATARTAKDFEASDAQRDRLLAQGVALRDTPFGTIWSRV